MDKVKSKVPKLRFPEFENFWEDHTLQNLSEDGFSNGVFNDPNKVGKGYRIINVKEMYVGDKILVDELTLVDITESEFKKNEVIYGDIFFTRSSLVKEGIAYSNVYLSNVENITFDGHLIRMRPNKKKADSKFLAYLFKTNLARKQFIMRGKTTTMTTIGQDDISTVTLAIPNLSEQQKIASFLTAVDDKIQQLTKKKELLEKYKKGVMQKIFPSTSSGQAPEIRFKDDDGNDYPDWEKKSFGEIFNISAGGDIDKSNVFSIKNSNYKYPVYSNTIKDKGLYGYSDIYRVEDECITVSGRGTLGVAFARDEKFFPIVRLLVLKPKNRHNVIFFENIINTMIFFVESTGVPQLTAPQISTYKVQHPVIEEQNKIADFLSSIDKKIDFVNTQLEKTKEFKKGLLQQMFV